MHFDKNIINDIEYSFIKKSDGWYIKEHNANKGKFESEVKHGPFKSNLDALEAINRLTKKEIT